MENMKAFEEILKQIEENHGSDRLQKKDVQIIVNRLGVLYGTEILRKALDYCTGKS